MILSSLKQGKQIFAENCGGNFGDRPVAPTSLSTTALFVHQAITITHHFQGRMSVSPATPSRYSSRSSSQWLFTKSETRNSPSIKEGLDPKLERSNRLKGIQFIDTVGRKLKLHQPTIATAAMFFHRFYMRQSMQKFHHFVPALRFLSFPSHSTSPCLSCLSRL